MLPSANRYTVVLDASVLFPNMKRDLLLRFFEAMIRGQHQQDQVMFQKSGLPQITKLVSGQGMVLLKGLQLLRLMALLLM